MKLSKCWPLMILLLLVGGNCLSIDLHRSTFDRDLLGARYNMMSGDEFDGTDQGTADTTDEFVWETKGLDYKRKSPTKAFLFSLVVPGAGQYYYGSKVKAGAFLGVEAITLLWYSKLNSDGNKLEDDFRAFHDLHWFRARYTDYLNRAYGTTDVSSTDDAYFTHTLPATNTQQYYEMTGKYDQFAWGWDDAVLNGDSLADVSGDNYRLTSPDTAQPDRIPTSVHRDTYQQMRADANSKFDQSKRVLYVTMFNHIISAFEAFLTTKKHNEDLTRAEHEFSSLQLRAKLKSSYARFDTPTLNLSYHFR